MKASRSLSNLSDRDPALDLEFCVFQERKRTENLFKTMNDGVNVLAYTIYNEVSHLLSFINILNNVINTCYICTPI